MKKIISLIAVSVCAVTMLSAQVLGKQGVENTLSTAFGTPYQVSADGKKVDEPCHFYGFHETLQARVDISIFTLEGMVNWGALTNYTSALKNGRYVIDLNGFTFKNTGITPFTYTNDWYQGKSVTDGITDSYYTNFIMRPIKNFEFGMGTRLNWLAGPAPAYGGMLWQPQTHLVQGGLKAAFPGGADVAGFMRYANCYARTALGARYVNDIVEVGCALPSGVTTNSFMTNFAIKVTPVKWLSIGSAIEGIWDGDSNLYVGATIGINKNLGIDAWFGIDNMAGKEDNDQWGTGAAVTIRFPKVSLKLRPEASFTFFTASRYSMAFYTGASLEYEVKKWTIGAWTSGAWGATDDEWYNKNLPSYNTTKDYKGGFIFDIRPYVTYQINGKHSVSAMVDIQSRTRFDNTEATAWASGVYWTYKI